MRKTTWKILVYGILAIIVVVGALNMLAPVLRSGQILLMGNDPWIEYWLTKYLVEHGIGSWWSLTQANPDTHIFWYPYGRDFTRTEHPGVPMFAAITYPIGKALGLNVMQWAAVTPVFFGIIAIIGAFFLGKELFNGKEWKSDVIGLIFAAFMATLISGTARSFAGFIEKQGYGVALMLFGTYFYLRALRRKSWVDGLVAGILVGLTFWFWGGYIFIFTLLALHLALLPFVRKIDNKDLITLTVLVASAYGVGLAYGVPAAFLKTKVVLALALSLVLVYISTILDNKKYYLYTLLAIGAAGAAALALGFIEIPSRVIYALGIRVDVKPIVATVAEHAGRTLTEMTLESSIAFVLSIFGVIYVLYRLITKPNEKWLFIFITGPIMLYLYYNMAYLSEISLAFFAPLALALIDWALDVLSPSSRAALSKMSSIEKLGAVFVLVSVLLLIPHSAILTFASRYQSDMSLNVYGKAWWNMLDYIKEYTPKDSVIVAWWDYGYWISVYTGRASLADGATCNTTQIWLLAHILMSNETEAVEYMEKYFHLKPNKTFVLAYFYAQDMGNDTWLILPNQGDMGKSIAMLFIKHGPNGPKPADLYEYRLQFFQKILPQYWYVHPQYGALTPKFDLPSDQLPLLYKLAIDSIYDLGKKAAMINPMTGQIKIVPRPVLRYFTPEYVTYDVAGYNSNNMKPVYIIVFLYKFIGASNIQQTQAQIPQQQTGTQTNTTNTTVVATPR